MTPFRFCLLIICAVFFTQPALSQSSDDDRGWIQGLLEDNLSAEGRQIRIEGFSGALSSRATIDQLTIADGQGVWLTLNDVALSWNRSALLRGRIEIAELSAQEVLLPRTPVAGDSLPDPEAQPFSLPELPVSVEIEELNIARAVLGEPILGVPAEVSIAGSASLVDGMLDVALGVDRLDGQAGELSLTASYANDTRTVSLDLSLTEGSGGIVATLIDLPDSPAIALKVQGQGPLDDFAADLSLATDGTDRLTGNLTLTALPADGPQGSAFTATLSGDIRPMLPAENRAFFGPALSLDVAGQTLADGRLRLETLDLTTEALTLTGNLALGPNKWPEQVRLSGRVANAEGGALLLPLPGVETRIDSLDLDVNFDASDGDSWSADLVLNGLDRPDFALERARINGLGSLSEGAGSALGNVAGRFNVNVTGMAPAEADLARALGDALSGDIVFDWREGAPLDLAPITLSGAGIDLNGSLRITGLRDTFAPQVSGTAEVAAVNLSRFSGLAGRDLGGSVNLTLTGSTKPLDGAFDATITGMATDLVTGIAEADRILAGQATLAIDAVRDENGILLRNLDVSATGGTISAEGRLRTGDSAARFDVALNDTALVLPALSGPARVQGQVDQVGTLWTLDTTASGPGGADLRARVQASYADGAVSDISGTGTVSADTIAPYGVIAGRDLGGAVDLAGSGGFNPLTQYFSVNLTGSTTDLQTGISQVDGLLTGEARLELDAQRDAKGIVLRNLDLQSSGLTAQASGEQTESGSVSRFDVNLPDASLVEPRLQGGARVQGTLRQVDTTYTLDTRATGPGGVDIDAEIVAQYANSVLGQVRGSGTVKAGDLAPYGALAQRDIAGSVDLSGSGSFDPQSLYFSADVQGTATNLATGVAQVDGLIAGTTTLRIDAERDGDGLLLRTLDLDADGVRVEATGRQTDTGSTARFDITLPDASRLEPRLNGAARIQGTLDQVGTTYRLDARATGPGGIDIDAEVSAEYADNVLGLIQGSGTVKAADLAPYGVFAQREIGGAVDVTGSGRYDPATQFFAADVTGSVTDLETGIAQLDGLLTGRSTLVLDAERDGDGLLLRNLDLDASGLIVTAEGVLRDANSGARFDIRLPEASRAVPGLNGAAQITGALDQAGDEWTLDATASGPGGVAVDAEIVAQYAENVLGRIRGSGRVRADSLAPYGGLTGRPIGGSLDVSGSGSFDPRDSTFSADVTGTAQDLRSGIAAVDKLVAGQTELALDAARDETGVISVRRLDLSTGQISANVSGALGTSASNLSYDVRLRDLGLFAPGFNGPASATGTASTQGGDYTIDASLTAPGDTSARVSGSIAPDASNADLSITGTAPLALANPFLEPNILTGTAGFDLRLNGRPALESLSGTVRTSGASLILPSAPLNLEDIAGTVSLSSGRAGIDLTAQASTGGSIAVSGPVTLSAPFNGDLAIRLTDVDVADPGLYETQVSGQLTLEGPLASSALLAGTLRLAEVEVRVPDSGLGTSGSRFELRHINESAASRQTRARAGRLESEGGGGGGGGGGLDYRLDILVQAPSQIFVRGRGLDAELGGEIRLRGTLSNIVPQGRFDLIRGRLDILGQRIDLDEASIVLQGSLVPTIGVVATTQRDETTIQFEIRGPVSEPDVTISSNPERPEEEVLALLLFGRDVTQISAFQALRIASAVNTLVGKSGTGIVDRLRMGFGVDDLDVSTAADGTTELRVGKYLTDNVYTDVTVGAEGQSEINLNLDITPSITARGTASSDGNTGIGIFFEKDY